MNVMILLIAKNATLKQSCTVNLDPIVNYYGSRNTECDSNSDGVPAVLLKNVSVTCEEQRKWDELYPDFVVAYIQCNKNNYAGAEPCFSIVDSFIKADDYEEEQ